MRPTNRQIIGIGGLIFGVGMFASGLWHVIRIGTCSSTGYSSDLGPVPVCPRGTGWWILFLIGGIFSAVIGGIVAASGATTKVRPAARLAVAPSQWMARAAAPAAPPAPDFTVELTRLTQLHASGALSDDEFTAAKARLLE